jgi:Kef-type K+ transport system membrane component KefB
LPEYQTLAVLAAFAFLCSVFASGLERTRINGALVYLFAGLACGPYGLGLLERNVDAEGVQGLAEFTLALVLF